jgi:hypothetical protein
MAKAIIKTEIISKLKNIIKTNRGIINPNEAVSKTGYSRDEIIVALNRLIELFEAKVVLDDTTGGLQFIFKYPLWQRGKKTAKEILSSVGRMSLKVFKTIYKATVGIILIAYTIIFAIILLLLLSGGDNNKGRSNGNGMLLLLFRAISDGIFWSAMSRPYYVQSDVYGNRYKTYRPNNNVEKAKGAGFIQGVFSFVFGPEVPPIEEESDVREVAAYVRLQTNGIITAANMIELSGIDYNKAESRLAEYCGKFDGFLEVNNDGIIYGNFENIMGEVSKGEHQNIIYYIDEIEPPVEFTGNKSGRNLGIICMNSFNLIMSFVILQMHNNPPEAYFNGEMNNILFDLIYGGFGFWLGWFPLIVSISYFVIPILRIPSYFIKKKSRNDRVLHKILIGNICSARKKVFTLNEIIEMSKTRIDIETDKVQQMMNRILIELQGAMEVSDDGTIIYIFERLYNEFHLKV